MVTVVARPPKPAALAGPSIICPGTPLTYTVLGTEPYSVSWTIKNGSPLTQSGNPANVNWGANPVRWLSAAYVSTDGLGCKSDTLKLNVSGITGLSITGIPGVCSDAVAYYEAQAYPGFDYQWQIIPANAGAIKSGQGKNGVEIFWQTPGTHKVRVTSCGLTADYNVVVWPTPSPIVSAPKGLCPEDSTLISTSSSYSAYSWQTAAGATLGNTPTIQIPSGSYVVAVTDANGCKGNVDFEMALYPKPNVTLTTADPTGFCNNSRYVFMTALVPDDGVFSFEWFYDGAPVGANSSSFASNQYGLYSVIVTNEYGCKAEAPPIRVFEYCAGLHYCTGGGGAPPCPPGSVQGVPDPTPRCDSISLVLNDYTGQYVPGSALWITGISGGNLVATATGDNASFIYPNAGIYIVIVKVLLQNGSVCEAVDSIDIEVAAQFSQRLACPGDSTRFIDESTRLPDAARR